MKFNICITEELSRTIEVEANSKEDALKIATDSYEAGEILLDYDDYNGKCEIYIKELF